MNGTPRNLICSLALLLSACLADERANDVCPDGELIVDGDVQICVTNVVTETGFLCSGVLLYQYELDGHVVCSNTDGLTISALREAVDSVHVPPGHDRDALPDTARHDPPGHSDAGPRERSEAAASGSAGETDPNAGATDAGSPGVPETDSGRPADAGEPEKDTGVDAGSDERPEPDAMDDVGSPDAELPDVDEEADGEGTIERQQADTGSGDVEEPSDTAPDTNPGATPDAGADTSADADEQGAGENDVDEAGDDDDGAGADTDAAPGDDDDD